MLQIEIETLNLIILIINFLLYFRKVFKYTSFSLQYLHFLNLNFYKF